MKLANILLYTLGAFGVVHKGEMVLSDGSVKAVAIKTIKCMCVHVSNGCMPWSYHCHEI